MFFFFTHPHFRAKAHIKLPLQESFGSNKVVSSPGVADFMDDLPSGVADILQLKSNAVGPLVVLKVAVTHTYKPYSGILLN